MFYFYTPLKHPKSRGFLIFSRVYILSIGLELIKVRLASKTNFVTFMQYMHRNAATSSQVHFLKKRMDRVELAIYRFL